MGRPTTPEIAYIHNGFAVAYDFCGACCYSGPAGDMPPCEDIETGDTARKMVMRQRGPEQLSTWTVIEGDCLEVMAGMEPGSFDAIVTDPPWPGAKIEIEMGWKGDAWWARVVEEMERMVGNRGKLILHIGSGVDPRRILLPISLPYVQIATLGYVPPRYRGNRLDEFDVAYHFGAGWLPKDRRVLAQTGRAHVSRGKRDDDIIHPCPRGITHTDWLLRSWVGPGRRVLDPFCGSGTTGDSAVRSGIEFVGIENVSKFVVESRRRIDEATRQGRLF